MNDKVQGKPVVEGVEAPTQREKQGKIYWHRSFYNALQLELYPYRHQLTFEDEHQLSKEPLRMDVLVIKKASGVKIEKNIGRLFEDHHIFEFKSEKDSLTQWDYMKVMGYANLYASFEKVALPDVTISLVSHRFSLALFGWPLFFVAETSFLTLRPHSLKWTAFIKPTHF